MPDQKTDASQRAAGLPGDPGEAGRGFAGSTQEYLLRALIDRVPDYLFVKDTKSRFVVANPAVAEDLGLTVDGSDRQDGLRTASRANWPRSSSPTSRR